MKRNPFSIAAAAISAVAVAGLTFAAPALADAGDPYSVGGVNQENKDNTALVNPQADVQLQIHKYLGMPTDGTANGTEQTVALPPLQGVNFDVYQVVGVDLTTNAGWEATKDLQNVKLTATDIANGYVIGASGTKYTLAQAATVTTDATGTATFTKVDGIGLYLVNENLSSSGTITNTQTGVEVEKSTITGAAPFLVTLPMTNPDDRTHWMYDVDVYPKNQADSITKQVLDGNIGTAGQDAYTIGKDLTYRLESTITVTDSNKDGKVSGADLGYYYIGDDLSQFVTFKSATLQIVKTDGSTVALTAGTDYVQTLDTATNKVQISFTLAGLDKLATAPGGKVQTDIVATVSSMPADGLVPNAAEFIPSNGWLASQGATPGTPGENPPTDTPDIPSNEVVSKYGDIVLQKTGSDTNEALAGAIFAVYRAGDNGTCEDADVTGTPVATSAETDASGFTKLDNLQLSNWYNDGVTSGEITDPTKFHSYCLVETKAPNGYQLLADPIEFDLTVAGDVVDLSAAWANTTRDASSTDNTGGNLAVVDQPDNLLNKLPLTGGQGVAALSVGGLVLIGGGLAYYRRSTKKA